jgi:hypothetical protein
MDSHAHLNTVFELMRPPRPLSSPTIPNAQPNHPLGRDPGRGGRVHRYTDVKQGQDRAGTSWSERSRGAGTHQGPTGRGPQPRVKGDADDTRRADAHGKRNALRRRRHA